jgi:hypothetical protein
MNAYERFVQQMRKAGRYYNDPTMQIGIAGKNRTIKADDLELDSEDYLINCDLKQGSKNELEEGDQVVMFKLKTKEEESETFIVLAKVVSAL